MTIAVDGDVKKQNKQTKFTNNLGHVEMGPWLKGSSDRLEKLWIKPRTPWYKGTDLPLQHGDS